MSKVYSRAAKLKAKKAKAGLPGLASAPKRKLRGKARMRQIKADPDAQRTVLEARARQSGKSPDDISEMRRPAYGEAAGQAIYAIHQGDTAKRLWEAYAGCSGAYKRYLSIVIGASLDAKTAKIEMMPERFEVDSDHTPDDRTDEERIRAASNSWATWKADIDSLSLRHSSAIYSAMCGWSVLMDAGQVTSQGERFVEAICELSDCVQKS